MKKTRSAQNASADFIPKIAKDVLSRKNADGTIAVMKLDNDRYFFSIDGLAAEIWSRFNGKTKLSRIKADVAAKISAPEGRFERDVRLFIAHLRKEHLIQSS